MAIERRTTDRIPRQRPLAGDCAEIILGLNYFVFSGQWIKTVLHQESHSQEDSDRKFRFQVLQQEPHPWEVIQYWFSASV